MVVVKVVDCECQIITSTASHARALELIMVMIPNYCFILIRNPVATGTLCATK
jgi:hypothetical protein